MSDAPQLIRQRVDAAPIVPVKTAWGIGALTLCFLIAGGVSMRRAYVARTNLNTVDARIVSSEVVSFGGKAQPRYRLQVEFLYTTAAGRHRVPYSFPNSHAERSAADNDALRYRMGSVHRIYFDPEQPYNILLDPGSAGRFFVGPLLLTAVGVILGGSLAFLFIRSSRYSCMACGANVELEHEFCFHCGTRIPTRKGKLKA